MNKYEKNTIGVLSSARRFEPKCVHPDALQMFETSLSYKWLCRVTLFSVQGCWRKVHVTLSDVCRERLVFFKALPAIPGPGLFLDRPSWQMKHRCQCEGSSKRAMSKSLQAIVVASRFKIGSTLSGGACLEIPILRLHGHQFP